MKRTLISLFAVLALVGCGRSEEVDSAEDADESTVVTSSESALTTELSDEVTQPMSVAASELATAASMRVRSHLQPPGCLTSTVNGATVTYVATDCTGPYGLVHVTGTLSAVYSRTTTGAIQVVVTGTGVKVNGATVDINSTVKASQAGTVKKAEVVSDSSGTGPRGNTITRNGAYTATYDPTAECMSIDGTWMTKAGIRTGSTVVTGLKRCKGACPAAGGKVVHTIARTVITVSYDGTPTAAWSASNGKSGTVTLQCK
jgi:hypothetical protein